MVYMYTVCGMWSLQPTKPHPPSIFLPSCTEYWHHVVCLTKVLILKKKKKQTANLKLGNDTNQTKTYNLIYQENALHSFLLEC